MEVVSWFAEVLTCTMMITFNQKKIKKSWILQSNSSLLKKFNSNLQKMIMKILNIIMFLISQKLLTVWRVVSKKEKKFQKISQQCLNVNFSSMISSMFLRLLHYLRKCKWNTSHWLWLFLNLRHHCWDWHLECFHLYWSNWTTLHCNCSILMMNFLNKKCDLPSWQINVKTTICSTSLERLETF